MGAFTAHLLEFISAVLTAWRTLIAGLIFFVASLPTNFLSAPARERIDRFIPPEIRRRGLKWVAGAFLFFACFQAWDTEHTARITAQNILPEDLVASFEMNNSSNLSNELNEIKVLFNNKGSRPAVVDEISLIVNLFHDEANDVAMRSDVCDDPSMLAAASLHLMGENVVSHHPINLLKEQNVSFYYYNADHYVIDGSVAGPPIVIDAGKSRGVSTYFKTDRPNIKDYNVIVWCPVLRFFDNDGRSYFTVCKGSLVATLRDGSTSGPYALPPVQILPPPPNNTTIYYSCLPASPLEK
jgi:hypothetical protein